jgi:predicted secreted acid phosphatase
MILRTYLFSIVIALFFLAVPAESSDWLNYVEDKGGDMFYVDMESIKSTSANTIRVLKKVEPAGSSGIASVLSEIEMDCKNSMMRYLKETTYFTDGKSRSASKDEKFHKVTIEDDDESLLELICSLKKSK